jgi:hypothetical protein
VLLDGVPAALVGLVLWLAHWRWAPAALGPAADADEDRASTLRSVYLFLALAVVVAVTLFNASQLLYYALGRALGVDRPGGVGGSILLAAAGPASAVLVYGAAWLYQRFAIRQQALVAAAGRPAGVRRLYTYLVALLALVALTVGLGGLLWTLADLATGAARSGGTEWWREQVALYATAALVGLPVWARHWRLGRGADADEARSLARRLYVYLALIGSMLVLLGSTARVLYEVLNLALGTTTTAALVSDLARALAVTVVGGGCAAYHWYALRQDARRTAAEPPAVAAAPAPVARLVRLSAPDAAALDQALAHLRARGIQAEPVEPPPSPAPAS